ncbi:MAG: sigma-70 family RNA polymerase sigma factor [Deltaproteobacteria bacterium]|nr:sigma-70 family RNA polymerase sigma factor [Nannocystaceae bacterium]
MSTLAQHAAPNAAPSSSVDVLVASHRRFLAFLERRLGDRALAEDILQSAFVRGIERIDQVRDGESMVAWFYRMLRNAVVDHHRRSGTAARSIDAIARQLDLEVEPPPDERASVCACLGELAAGLPSEQARAIRRVDLEGAAVKEYAEEAGITANNAGVRLFRARENLRKAVARCCGTCAEHGCSDCTCGPR